MPEKQKKNRKKNSMNHRLKPLNSFSVPIKPSQPAVTKYAFAGIETGYLKEIKNDREKEKITEEMHSTDNEGEWETEESIEINHAIGDEEIEESIEYMRNTAWMTDSGTYADPLHCEPSFVREIELEVSNFLHTVQPVTASPPYSIVSPEHLVYLDDINANDTDKTDDVLKGFYPKTSSPIQRLEITQDEEFKYFDDANVNDAVETDSELKRCYPKTSSPIQRLEVTQDEEFKCFDEAFQNLNLEPVSFIEDQNMRRSRFLNSNFPEESWKLCLSEATIIQPICSTMIADSNYDTFNSHIHQLELKNQLLNKTDQINETTHVEVIEQKKFGEGNKKFTLKQTSVDETNHDEVIEQKIFEELNKTFVVLKPTSDSKYETFSSHPHQLALKNQLVNKTYQINERIHDEAREQQTIIGKLNKTFVLLKPTSGNKVADDCEEQNSTTELKETLAIAVTVDEVFEEGCGEEALDFNLNISTIPESESGNKAADDCEEQKLTTELKETLTNTVTVDEVFEEGCGEEALDFNLNSATIPESESDNSEEQNSTTELKPSLTNTAPDDTLKTSHEIEFNSIEKNVFSMETSQAKYSICSHETLKTSHEMEFNSIKKNAMETSQAKISICSHDISEKSEVAEFNISIKNDTFSMRYSHLKSSTRYPSHSFEHLEEEKSLSLKSADESKNETYCKSLPNVSDSKINSTYITNKQKLIENSKSFHSVQSQTELSLFVQNQIENSRSCSIQNQTTQTKNFHTTSENKCKHLSTITVPLTYPEYPTENLNASGADCLECSKRIKKSHSRKGKHSKSRKSSYRERFSQNATRIVVNLPEHSIECDFSGVPLRSFRSLAEITFNRRAALIQKHRETLTDVPICDLTTTRCRTLS